MHALTSVSAMYRTFIRLHSREINPRFYMFCEGINPSGYEKIPNSVAHANHKDHDQGGHHHEGGHDIPMEEGFHHTNDHAKTVEENFPEAKRIHSEKLGFTEESEGWFKPLHMEYSLCNVYQLRE